MSILREEFAHLIEALNAEKFRVFIQTYLAEKYQDARIYITDGPYDGGNDLTITVGDKEIKKNIQVTVQKEYLERKILADLTKANENIYPSFHILKKWIFIVIKN